jgi:D-beta-D-heptose 7-phosphate kinase/D-beta-D-heptose 1-phosphate adenosyltransferase
MSLSSSKVLNVPSLKRKISSYRKAGKTVVFTNGCFDILHYGHVSYLEAAKKNAGRVLIIGLNSDRSVRGQGKGPERPIVPQKERALLLAALACVDHVVIFDEPTPERLICALGPDILIKGADWKGKPVAGAEAVKARGGKVEFIRYINGLSTTNMVARIRACSGSV